MNGLMGTEQLWNGTGVGKRGYSDGNMSQCHFAHHKSHGLAWDRTRFPAVTVPAITQPNASENRQAVYMGSQEQKDKF